MSTDLPLQHLDSAMTDADMKQLISVFAQAIMSQDHQLLRSVTTEDVVWSLPGSNILSGNARGSGEILRRGKRLADYNVDIAVLHVVYGLTGIGLLLHNTGRRFGRTLDEHLTTVFQPRGKLITRADTYLSDVTMLDAYFANPEPSLVTNSEAAYATRTH